MSGIGWGLLGTGGLSVALAIALWLTTRSHAKAESKLRDTLAERNKVITAIDGARAQLTLQVSQLEADRAMILNEKVEIQRRHEQQIADLKKQVSEFQRRALAGASNAELGDMFGQMFGGKQS